MAGNLQHQHTKKSKDIHMSLLDARKLNIRTSKINARFCPNENAYSL